MLLPYCLVLRAASFVTDLDSIDIASNCTQVWDSSIDTLIPSSLAQSILSILLIFLQAALLNHIVNKHRMTAVPTLFPGMLYIMLSSIFLENLTLTQYMIGNGLCLLSITNFIDIYKKHKPETELFMSGFWLSLSFVCSPIYGLLLIPLIGAFISLRTFNLKELLQIFVGIIGGGFLVASIQYFLGSEGLMESYFEYHFTGLSSITNWYVLGFFIFVLAMLLLSLFSFQKFQIKKSLPVRKKLSIMYLMLASSLGTILMSCTLNLNVLYYLWIPMAFFMAMLIIDYRKLMLGEIIHTICIVLILNNHFNIVSLF